MVCSIPMMEANNDLNSVDSLILRAFLVHSYEIRPLTGLSEPIMQHVLLAVAFVIIRPPSENRL